MHEISRAVSKKAPEIVTAVPPVTDPRVGLIEKTKGEATYWKSIGEALREIKSAPLLLTVSDTDEGAADEDEDTTAGLVQTIVEEDTKPAATSTVPKRHVKSFENSKLEPTMVTDVPPVTGPNAGDIDTSVAPTPYENVAPLVV